MFGDIKCFYFLSFFLNFVENTNYWVHEKSDEIRKKNIFYVYTTFAVVSSVH